MIMLELSYTPKTRLSTYQRMHLGSRTRSVVKVLILIREVELVAEVALLPEAGEDMEGQLQQPGMAAEHQWQLLALSGLRHGVLPEVSFFYIESRTYLLTDAAPAGGANGGRTPAWKSGGDGGRTPGWADGSRTVNPYDGSRTAYGAGNRTPAWSSGAKTPAYGLSDGFAAGSKTPGYGGGDSWGSKTPAYQPQQHQSESSWQNQPASNGWSSNAYDAPTPGANASAPTPAAMNAPTPGAYSAPTPAPYNAPTPAAAPTPAPGWGGGWGAPTPQAMDAPTPGAQQGYYAAPTPGAYGVPETPAANWQDDGPRYVD